MHSFAVPSDGPVAYMGERENNNVLDGWLFSVANTGYRTIMLFTYMFYMVFIIEKSYNSEHVLTHIF